MAGVRRMRVALTGAACPGGGVMTFYSMSDTATGWPAAIKSFLNATPLMWPASLTFTVPNTGDVIDGGTGELTGVWTDGAAQTPFSGTNTGDWAAGVGIRVVWNTGAIVAGRRVKGSTFFVPVAAGIFDTDGTIDTASVTAVTSAATTLLGGTHAMGIFSRPLPERPGAHGTLPARGGGTVGIVSATVPDKVSWLRSRRD